MKFKFVDGSELNAWKDKNGYMICKVNGKNTKVHRHQFKLQNGYITKGLTINHKDGNKCNNEPSNLEELSFSENAKHAWSNGLAKPCKGSSHGRSILDEIKVLTIITMPKNNKNGTGSGWSNKSLSEIYKISQTRINNIRNGREWRHVHESIRD